MEPTIKTGSLVITKHITPNTLQKNDIITFIPPIKKREFVTHRIVNKTQKEKLTIFNTKGDNNKNEDMWTLADGGIVGKVILTIPYLGYVLTFAQSKLGILLFILIPAIYIIVEEVSSIIALLKKERSKNVNSSTSAVIILLIGTFFSLPQSTYSLLSDSVNLGQNMFTLDTISPENPHDTEIKKDEDDRDHDEIEDKDEKDHNTKSVESIGGEKDHDDKETDKNKNPHDVSKGNSELKKNRDKSEHSDNTKHVLFGTNNGGKRNRIIFKYRNNDESFGIQKPRTRI